MNFCICDVHMAELYLRLFPVRMIIYSNDCIVRMKRSTAKVFKAVYLGQIYRAKLLHSVSSGGFPTRYA